MLVPPLELESNVSLWLSAVSQYKARVTFCSYSVMEMCTKGLGAQTGLLRVSAPPSLSAPLLGECPDQDLLGWEPLAPKTYPVLPAHVPLRSRGSGVGVGAGRSRRPCTGPGAGAGGSSRRAGVGPSGLSILRTPGGTGRGGGAWVGACSRAETCGLRGSRR